MFEKHNIFTIVLILLSGLNNIFGFILLLAVTAETEFSGFYSYFLVSFIGFVFVLNTYLLYRVAQRNQRALLYLFIFYAVQALSIKSESFSLAIGYGISIPVSWSVNSILFEINLTGIVISTVALLACMAVHRSSKPSMQPGII